MNEPDTKLNLFLCRYNKYIVKGTSKGKIWVTCDFKSLLTTNKAEI